MQSRYLFAHDCCDAVRYVSLDLDVALVRLDFEFTAGQHHHPLVVESASK